MKKIIFLSTILLQIVLGSCSKCDPIQIQECGLSAEEPAVDLIVLIDASSSMESAAAAISNAAQKAIETARDSCSKDLSIHFLGVDGTWAGTVFDTSHRQFIISYNGLVDLAGDRAPFGDPLEQGANAIEDLAYYAPWRPGSCRSIFYISDEELDSDTPLGDIQAEDQATQNAIQAAQEQGVTIFTHYITKQGRGENILQNYNDLTSQTGGFNLTSAEYSDVGFQLYIDLMPAIVCNACNGCTLRTYLEE